MKNLRGAMLLSTFAAVVVNAQAPPDRILYNGKILTVDRAFTVAQAVAVRGERIVAVGADSAVRKLAGPRTIQTDLKGHTVVPGLIDNHLHYLRGSDFGADEIRWHGIDTRREALAAISARAKISKPGQWIFVLGGWHEQQFSDKPGGFTQEELDAVAPDNPVFIQRTYTVFYMNGLATKAIAPAIGKLYKGGSVVRTNSEDGRIVMYAALSHFPYGDTVDKRMAEVKTYNRYLNSMGLTTVYDVGYIDGSYEPVAILAARNDLGMRIFYTARYWAETPWTANAAAEQLDREKPFQRTLNFGLLGVGEHVYGPIHDSNAEPDVVYSKAKWDEFEKIATVAAKRGWPINEHAQLDSTANIMMDIGEKINQKYPVRNLRWTLGHMETATAETIDRAKRLGWVITVHNHLVKAMPPKGAPPTPLIRQIQDSGIVWGLGSDGTIVATYNPFHTIWEYTSGKIYPNILRYQPSEVITRQEALIAHTRSNAYILFMEKDLGSLETGKLADLLVLDRDYMEVPVDEIRQIKPTMTMVGGKIVFEAKP